jgi:septum formation protein
MHDISLFLHVPFQYLCGTGTLGLPLRSLGLFFHGPSPAYSYAENQQSPSRIFRSEMPQNPDIPLILASASISRQAILHQAGLLFEAIPAYVDETALKESAKAEGWTAAEAALVLAGLKAERISRRFPGALVIGADQLLVCGGDWFDKPTDLAEAAQHLERLSGHAHVLETACCAYRGGSRVWHVSAAPKLVMRKLSLGFITSYLAAEGTEICSSVGAYRLEGLGSQLFSQIEGDFFTILGLPLLALLGYLRQAGVLAD